jgi:hypothetical protein
MSSFQNDQERIYTNSAKINCHESPAKTPAKLVAAKAPQLKRKQLPLQKPKRRPRKRLENSRKRDLRVKRKAKRVFDIARIAHMSSKDHTAHWHEATSSALNSSFFKDVSQSCFVFDIANFE